MTPMLIIQFLVLTFVVSGVIIFALKKTMYDSTQGAVNRLNKETEEVRAKQTELNEKIKQANEELQKRQKEADALVNKMKEQAEEKAKEEREKLLVKARSEADEIIAKAQATKDALKRSIEKEMDIKAVDVTVSILGIVLSQKARDALHESLFLDFLDELNKVDMSVITTEVAEAEVVTAAPLDKKFKEKLSEFLKIKMKKEITIKTSEDPKILSGVLLKFGSLQLDGSLQNYIKDAAVHLREKIEKGA